MGAHVLPTIHSADQSSVVPARKCIYSDARSDQCSSKPQRQSIRLHGGSVLGNLKLLQEEPEPGNNEAEPHQSQARANPCQKRSLGSQIIPEVSAPPTLWWFTHFVPRHGDSNQFACLAARAALCRSCLRSPPVVTCCGTRSYAPFFRSPLQPRQAAWRILWMRPESVRQPCRRCCCRTSK